MKSRIAWSLVMLCACRADAPTFGTSVRQGAVVPDLPALSNLPPRVLSAREDALIRQLEAMFPGARGADLRRQLTDQRVFAIRLSAHPSAQAIIDQIAAIRRQRADSSLLIAQKNQQRIVNTLVAMAQDWPDSTIAAIVLRRPLQNPSDVVLISPRASVSDLASGLRALDDLRQRQPEDATQNSRLVVRGSAVPLSWTRNGTDKAAAQTLKELTAKTAVHIRGIGQARTVEIPVLVSSKKHALVGRVSP
jgi:hypothetical protein